MQASQGLRISIKNCCNFERISGLAFSIFTGDQTFLQWTNKRVIVSIITNPRAWSKTMGIASLYIKITAKKKAVKIVDDKSKYTSDSVYFHDVIPA